MQERSAATTCKHGFLALCAWCWFTRKAVNQSVERERKLEDVLREVGRWLHSPQPSGGGHIATHAVFCPELAERVREAVGE